MRLILFLSELIAPSPCSWTNFASAQARACTAPSPRGLLCDPSDFFHAVFGLSGFRSSVTGGHGLEEMTLSSLSEIYAQSRDRESDVSMCAAHVHAANSERSLTSDEYLDPAGSTTGVAADFSTILRVRVISVLNVSSSAVFCVS